MSTLLAIYAAIKPALLPLATFILGHITNPTLKAWGTALLNAFNPPAPPSA